MKIADTEIANGKCPYIVAEISGNHCGHIENAIKLIKVAKKIAADAVKTQCYDPDSMTLDIKKPDFIVQDGLWRGRSLYDLYSKSHTPPSWHKDLYRAAHSEGITIFSSVFDKRGVDLLSNLGCPAYKIASFEITDTPLIEYAHAVGKPLIISTGTASDAEILEANEASGREAAFLHCTSEYPALVSNANLRKMYMLRELLLDSNKSPVIGISDHTLGSEIPIAATIMGASIIEKHLRLDDVDPHSSEDIEFSEDPAHFSEMIHSVSAVWGAMAWRDPSPASRQFRRSLYVIKDIKKGEPFTEDNIRSIRPGYGMPPSRLKNILGRKATRNWRRGDPLS